MESREVTKKWFEILNPDVERVLQRKYNCPNCRDFVVYHIKYEFNTHCYFCEARVRNIPDDVLVLKR